MTALHRLSRKLGLFFLCLLASACSENKLPQATPKGPAGAVPATYQSELAALNTAIAEARAMLPKRSEDHLLPVETANLLIERARLSGNLDDYAQAQTLLDAVSSKSAPSQACLTQARLHLSLHRLTAAGSALDRCPITASKSEMAGLLGDIAFYSGRYAEAAHTYGALVNQIGLPQDYARLARLKSKMGAPGEAAALMEAAEKRYHGPSATMRAWFKLQRGSLALERGRYDEALALFKLAGDALPNWWQTEDLIAELKRVQAGSAQGAAPAVEKVHQVELTPVRLCRGKPCQPDASNEKVSGAGASGAEAQALQARTIDEGTLQRFPQAAAGHLLNHELKSGKNPARALELAEMNFAARPYGDAAIGLARAQLANRNAAKALSILKKQQAAGWETAELYWVMRLAWLAQGDTAAAAQGEARALALNPASAQMYGAQFFSPH